MQKGNGKDHVLKYKLAYSGIILLVYIVGKNIPLYKVDRSAYQQVSVGVEDLLVQTIGGDFICNGKEIPCRLLLSPDIRSLNFLLRKLGVNSGE